MGDNAVLEKGIDPTAGAVNELVRDNEVAGFYLRLKATNGVNGDNMFHPERLEGVDISLDRDFSGGDAVPLAVAGQEGNTHPLQPPDGNGVTGRAKGRSQVNFLNISEPLNIVEPTAANNPNFRLWHYFLLLP